MAIVTFIPELWTARLQLAIDGARVLSSPAVTNRDYEGEVSRMGDTLHINALLDPAVRTYGPGAGNPRPSADANRNARTVITSDTLATLDQLLVINQADYFGFELDDVDRAQAMDGGGLLATAISRAGNRMAEKMDDFVGDAIVAAATDQTAAASARWAAGVGETGASADANKAFVGILVLKAALDTQNVPQSGRYLVVDPGTYSLLLELNKFIDASAYGSTSPIQNGEVGRILGFTVYVTTLTSVDMVAGHPMVTTLAQQLTAMEAYRPEDSFADAVKGLNVYGAKVLTRPEPGGSSLVVIGLHKIPDVSAIV